MVLFGFTSTSSNFNGLLVFDLRTNFNTSNFRCTDHLIYIYIHILILFMNLVYLLIYLLKMSKYGAINIMKISDLSGTKQIIVKR